MDSGGLQRFFDDRFVRNYDRCVAPLERSIFFEARQRLARCASGLVLDLGAGTGANFMLFGDSARHVVAVDRELRMLMQSKERTTLTRVDRAVSDAEALPFATARFDTVIATLLFCTVRNPKRALAEVVRVLVPGGRLLLLEHVRSSSAVLGLLQDCVNPVQRLIAGGCNLNRRTETLLERSGFRVQRRQSRFAGMLVEIEAISTPEPY